MKGPLIQADELALLLATGEVTVLDVRYRMGGPPGREQYAAGHVPEATYVDLDLDLASPPDPTGAGGRHPLPDPAAFGEAMRRAGVGAGRPVVVYDNWGGRAASRAWWLLRFHGHRDVRVLDGGWSRWVASHGPVDTGEATVARGDFDPVPGGLPVAGPASLPAVVVDARAPERYRGETEPIDPVAGHVPGAVNVPTDANLGPDGRFRTPEELRATYAGVGAVAGAEVAAYCGSGVTACHDVLAMTVAGVSAALYPGSWSDWVSDPSRPVERGR